MVCMNQHKTAPPNRSGICHWQHNNFRIASHAPTFTMVSSQEESALDLKNNGNSHFVKRRFTEALACYSEGIAICDKSTTTTTSPKNVTEIADVVSMEEIEATLYSNRSGCYYEMGDYGKLSVNCWFCVRRY